MEEDSSKCSNAEDMKLYFFVLYFSVFCFFILLNI